MARAYCGTNPLFHLPWHRPLVVYCQVYFWFSYVCEERGIVIPHFLVPDFLMPQLLSSWLSFELCLLCVPFPNPLHTARLFPLCPGHDLAVTLSLGFLHSSLMHREHFWDRNHPYLLPVPTVYHRIWHRCNRHLEWNGLDWTESNTCINNRAMLGKSESFHIADLLFFFFNKKMYLCIWKAELPGERKRDTYY